MYHEITIVCLLLTELDIVANREQSAEQQENASADGGTTASDEGSRLVRIPIDELQAAK